jgi:hypothetical protein
MGRTACTEPQCLHKGALYLFTFMYEYWNMSRRQVTHLSCTFAALLLPIFLQEGRHIVKRGEQVGKTQNTVISGVFLYGPFTQLSFCEVCRQNIGTECVFVPLPPPLTLTPICSPC